MLVFELVQRRRRLMERYALLWLFASSVLLILAVWKRLLNEVIRHVGIYYAPSAPVRDRLASCSLLLHLASRVFAHRTRTRCATTRDPAAAARHERLHHGGAGDGDAAEDRRELTRAT